MLQQSSPLRSFHILTIVGTSPTNDLFTTLIDSTSDNIFPMVGMWILSLQIQWVKRKPITEYLPSEYRVPVLWICVSTYVIKLLRQRGHYIILSLAISL